VTRVNCAWGMEGPRVRWRGGGHSSAGSVEAMGSGRNSACHIWSRHGSSGVVLTLPPGRASRRPLNAQAQVDRGSMR
jgi:hypothetical protein